MARLTDRERALIEAFRWMATVSHEAHHRAGGEGPPLPECEHRTCRYAVEVIARAEAEEGTR